MVWILLFDNQHPFTLVNDRSLHLPSCQHPGLAHNRGSFNLCSVGLGFKLMFLMMMFIRCVGVFEYTWSTMIPIWKTKPRPIFVQYHSTGILLSYKQYLPGTLCWWMDGVFWGKLTRKYILRRWSKHWGEGLKGIGSLIREANEHERKL